MGVNAIVIVENSQCISLDEFISGLRNDLWGKRTLNGWNNEEESWSEFEWEDKCYFSWNFPPRVAYLGLYDNDGIDVDNTIQITFLKAMLTVKRLAGGPIFVGNDVLNYHFPADTEDGRPFSLPGKLDIFIANWRDVESLDVDDPYMIF